MSFAASDRTCGWGSVSPERGQQRPPASPLAVQQLPATLVRNRDEPHLAKRACDRLDDGVPEAGECAQVTVGERFREVVGQESRVVPSRPKFMSIYNLVQLSSDHADTLAPPATLSVVASELGDCNQDNLNGDVRVRQEVGNARDLAESIFHATAFR